MTQQQHSNEGLVLSGLDGANPLAFLAVLGALRGLAIAWPDRRVRLSWVPLDAWRPQIHTDDSTLSQEEVLDGLDRFLDLRPGHKALEIDDNLEMSRSTFRKYALSAIDRGSQAISGRAFADFVAAFGCDVVSQRKGDNIEPTAFRLGTKAGHQESIKAMRELATKTGRNEIEKSLFRPWTRQDPKLSLRWDPEDNRRYALRWGNPSNEPSQTEWGANRLAYEALPLFPTAPFGRTLSTTGSSSGSNRVFTWPIWDVPVDLDTIRSLVSLRSLGETPPNHDHLSRQCVTEVFRCQRIVLDQGRKSFLPSRPA